MKKAPGSPHGFPPKLPEKEIVIVHFAGRPFLIVVSSIPIFPSDPVGCGRFRSDIFSQKHLTCTPGDPLLILQPQTAHNDWPLLLPSEPYIYIYS